MSKYSSKIKRKTPKNEIHAFRKEGSFKSFGIDTHGHTLIYHVRCCRKVHFVVPVTKDACQAVILCHLPLLTVKSFV